MRLLNSVLSTSEIPRRLEKSLQYQQKAEEYLNNARKLVTKHEFAKASELLWGTTAEFIKAISVLYGRIPTGHREIVDVGKHIALELGDANLNRLISREAQALHANFYEDFMSKEIFAEHYEAIIELTKKLLKIINQKRAEFSVYIH